MKTKSLDSVAWIYQIFDIIAVYMNYSSPLDLYLEGIIDRNSE